MRELHASATLERLLDEALHNPGRRVPLAELRAKRDENSLFAITPDMEWLSPMKMRSFAAACVAAVLSCTSAQEPNAEELLDFTGHGWENYLERFAVKDIKTASAEKGADEVLRVIWSPTFNKPSLYEAVRKGDKWTITLRVLSGKGGYEWGTLESTRSIDVPLLDAKALDLVRGNALWKPLNMYEIALMSGTMDGERWRVDHWTPKLSRTMFLHSPECLSAHITEPQVRDPKDFVSVLNLLQKEFQ